MANITITIPHGLGKAEARRRIAAQMSELRQQQPVLLGGLADRWEGDTMHFRLAAMGDSVTGTVAVEEKFVRIEVVLPGLLGALAGFIQSRIQERGQKLLGGPISRDTV